MVASSKDSVKMKRYWYCILLNIDKQWEIFAQDVMCKKSMFEAQIQVEKMINCEMYENVIWKSCNFTHLRLELPYVRVYLKSLQNVWIDHYNPEIHDYLDIHKQMQGL